jgi:hypothetical protein
MHLIAGQPGAGKTTIALKAAATVSSGGQWPDGTLAEQGNVVIWSGEETIYMAADIGAALIGVTHFTKRSEGIAPIDRVTGSVAFGALARIVLVAAKQQEALTARPGRVC